MKRWIWAFALAVLLSCLAGTAFAMESSGEFATGFKWSLDDQGTLTISGEGRVCRYYDNRWNLVDFPWRDDRDSIRRVVVGSGVTEISDKAFYDCEALESVSISETVTHIDDEVFGDCPSLASIDVDKVNEHYRVVDGVLWNEDGELCCYPGGKKDIYYIVPAGATIRQYAFSGAAHLQRVYFGMDTYIMQNRFGSCPELRAVYFPPNDEDAEYLADAFGSNGSTMINFDCTEQDCIDGIYKGVGWHYDSRAHTLTIFGSGAMEDYATTDENSAVSFAQPWDGYSVERVVVEEGVTAIGSGAFGGLATLTSAKLPAGLTDVGDYAFENSALQKLTLPASVRRVGARACARCESLRTVELSEGLESIGDMAFCDTAISGITLPATLKSLGEQAFYGCEALKNINVGEGNAQYSSADGVLFSKDGAELIWYGAGRTASTYQVPEGVRVLRDYAFAHAGRLSGVHLPASLTTVAEKAFYNTRISEIVYGGTAKQWRALGIGGQFVAMVRFADGSYNSRFADVSECGRCGDSAGWALKGDGTLIIYGNGAMEDFAQRTEYSYDRNGYRYSEVSYTCPWWGHRDSITAVEVDDGITAIGNAAFATFEKLERISLPSSLKRVGKGAFYENSGLKDVWYGDAEKAWNAIQFGENNEKLLSAKRHYDDGIPSPALSLALPAELVEIEDSAFAGGAFTHVYMGEKVASIGAKAFSGCAKLAYVSIPGENTAIAANAFDGCDALTVIACREDSPAYLYAINHGLKYRLIS